MSSTHSLRSISLTETNARNDGDANFCAYLIFYYPLSGDVAFDETGLIPYLIGLAEVTVSILFLLWMRRKEKLAKEEGGENAAANVIFPAFKLCLYLNILAALSSGLRNAFFLYEPISNQRLGEALYFAVYLTVHHTITEGTAFLLLQRGCGKNAARVAAWQAILWGALCFFMYTISYLSVIPTFIMDGICLILYLVIWLVPLKYLFRRPAAIFYAKFWVVYRLLILCIDFGDFSQVLGDCSFMIFIAFVDPISLFIAYWALLKDCHWWQGIDLAQERTASYARINDNMEGIDFNAEAARELATTLDRIRVEENVKMLNFARIKVDLNNPASYLGGGSFSRVYKGTYAGKECAIKLIRTADLTSDVIRKVAEEASILSSLKHPNIVSILGVSVLPPSVCLVLEYCEFGSLSDIIRGYGFDWNLQTLPPLKISKLDQINLALGCAKGLAAVHSIGPAICHRDVKSFNFLVNSHLQVKIADLELGIFRTKNPIKLIPSSHSGASSLSEVTSNPGKDELVAAIADGKSPLIVDVENMLPNWLAPEVIINRKFKQPSDVFALGTVIWEIFSRQLPFENIINAKEIRDRIVNGYKHPLPETILTNPVGQLVLKCWEFDPHNRPSADDVAAILENILENSFQEMILAHPVEKMPDFTLLQTFYENAYKRTGNAAQAATSATRSHTGEGTNPLDSGSSARGGFYGALRMLNPVNWFAGFYSDKKPPILPSETSSHAHNQIPFDQQSVASQHSSDHTISAENPRRQSEDFYTYSVSKQQSLSHFFQFSFRTPKGTISAHGESEYTLPNNMSRTSFLSALIPENALTSIHLVKSEKYWSDLEMTSESWAIFTTDYPHILVHGTSSFYELFNIPSSFGTDYQLLSLSSLLFPDTEAMPAYCRNSNFSVQNAVKNEIFRKLRIQFAKDFLQSLKKHENIHDIVYFHLPYLNITKPQINSHHSVRLSAAALKEAEETHRKSSFRSNFFSMDSNSEKTPAASISEKIRGYNLMCSVHAFPIFPQSSFFAPTARDSTMRDSYRDSHRDSNRESTPLKTEPRHDSLHMIREESKDYGALGKIQSINLDESPYDFNNSEAPPSISAPPPSMTTPRSSFTLGQGTPSQSAIPPAASPAATAKQHRPSSANMNLLKKPMYFAILFNELNEFSPTMPTLEPPLEEVKNPIRDEEAIFLSMNDEEEPRGSIRSSAKSYGTTNPRSSLSEMFKFQTFATKERKSMVDQLNRRIQSADSQL